MALSPSLFYLFAAVLGGALLLVSLVAGGHHPAGGHGHGHDAGDAEGLLAGLFSLQVWTYALAFAGLTGLLLQHFTAERGIACAALAGGSGLAAGLVARALVRRAARAPGAQGITGSADLVGQGGEVVLPFGPGQTGKVRVRVRGEVLDLLATTDERACAAGDEVLIVDMRGDTAVVSAGKGV